MTTIPARAGFRSLRERLPTARGAFRLLNVALVAAIATLGAAAYFAVRSTPAKTAATVRTGTVSRGVVLSSVSATGSVVAPENLSVGFEQSGQLAEVDVKAGQHVSKGELLGKLDPTTQQEAVQQAEATLASAEAALKTTLAGVTPATRKQDRISLTQAKAQIGTAQVAVAQAKASEKQDARTQAVSLSQANAQLHVDRGNESAYVTKVATDKTTVAADQAAYNAAVAKVTNDQSRIASDKAQIQSLTDAKNALSLEQTQDQQQLSADQATLTKQSSSSGKSRWQSTVDDDQAKVNADATALQENTGQQSTASYQESLDETALTADQQTETDAESTLTTDKATLTQDQASIVTYESKIVADKQAIQNATLARASATMKDAQAVQSAEQQVSSARLSAKATAAGNAVKEAPADAGTVAQQQAAVTQAEASLADAQRALDQTVLRAPVSGIVASVGGIVGQTVSADGTSSNASSSSSSSTSGSGSSSSGSSGAGTAFVNLVGVSSLEATAEFAESDATKLRVGQAATVTIPALSNKELAAHVVAVGESADSSSSVVEYEVTVALDRRDAQLKPGMTANVSIVTAERDNVLNVPSSAVTGSGANASVKVIGANGVQTTKRVVAGLVGDSTTEIVSGLRAGQRVVTSTATLSSLSNLGTSSTSSSTTGTGLGRAAFLGGGGGGAFRFGGP